MTLYRKEAKDSSVLRYYFVQIDVCHLHLQTVQIQWTTLKTGAARSPKLLILQYQSTRYNIPRDQKL